jgi:hypothetical protein
VAWYGIAGFWGHIRHFVASAIATEDVDSRDWMSPDDPKALTERVARLLGGGTAGATVTERLGRDVWIDYLADTGDDVTVSRAVAGLVFADYELPDPARPGAFLLAPRGDILLFGGDTAYPVATADEIRDRVIAPFNQVLAERADGRRRVLAGIPGNHDWYDGLDGFGRMFRRHVDYDVDGAARPTLHGSSRTMLGHYAEWAVKFVAGGHVDKPKTLDLLGYTAVQGASYFVLPIAPGVPILAVDRQLKNVDSRQRFFFASWLNDHVAASPWVMLPDPVYAFGRPSPTGFESVAALGLSLGSRPHLVLAGDIHHYRRDVDGPTLHVTAGGGGAFLHPAALGGGDRRKAEVEWPEAAQSRALLWQVPWTVMLGRSGLLPHLAFVLLLAPLVAGVRAPAVSPWALGLVTAVVALVFSLIGGVRRQGLVAVIAIVVAAMISASSMAIRAAFEWGLAQLGATAAGWLVPELQLGVLVLFATFSFGAYLALLTWLGYESGQAFTALDHPGFRHFVRLRVHADGSAIDGWCVGLVNPVRDGEPPVIVDSFTWKAR